MDWLIKSLNTSKLFTYVFAIFGVAVMLYIAKPEIIYFINMFR